VGSVDPDSPAEIVIGLDSVPGAGGWFEVLDDRLGGYVSLGWRNLGWEAFKSAGGSTFPAVGQFK
jgi:hypothetical protein